MLKQALLEEYRGRQSSLEAMGRALQAHLVALLERQGLQVQVTWRVKSLPSLARKLARPDRTYQRLEDVTDLVGLRIITYFEDTIERAARLVEERFRVDIDRSVDKRMLQEPNSFGYRSLHYVCHPPMELLAEHPEWKWPFEIQIRTILQHAWAEIEHDLGYRNPESVPLPVRRRFSRLAGLLEIADQEFVELRRTMEAYAREVRRPAGLTSDSLELDTVSLGSLAGSPQVADLDSALARSLGRPLETALFYPDYVIRMLQAVELNRPAHVLERLQAFAPRMLEFAERYFRFTQQTWGFSGQDLDSVKGGYSLILFAHWQALCQAELELHRVERMRLFYQRLDYPRNEQEARRVARLFVQSFSDWRESTESLTPPAALPTQPSEHADSKV